MLRLLAIVTLLAAFVGISAQGNAGISITAPPGVNVIALEQAGGPFLKSFNSGSAALIPYSAILTNNTNQPIIVVVADWKYIDAHGFVKHFWLRAKRMSDPIGFLSSLCKNQKLLPAFYKGN